MRTRFDRVTLRKHAMAEFDGHDDLSRTSTRSPDHKAKWRRAILHALGGACALGLLCGNTCINEDFITGDVIFALTDTSEPLVIDQSLPYRARNTVDFVLLNTTECPFNARVVAASGTQDVIDAITDDTEQGSTVGIDFGNIIADAGLGVFIDAGAGPGLVLTDIGVDDAQSDEDAATSPENELSFFTEEFVGLRPQLPARGRFGDDQLPNSTRVFLFLQCLPDPCRSDDTGATPGCEEFPPECVGTPNLCEGLFQYAVGVAQLECRNNGDCDSDERCNVERGVCERRTDASSCQTPTGQPASSSSTLWIMGLLTLGLFSARRQRRREAARARRGPLKSGAASRAMHVLMITTGLTLVLLCASAGDAEAQRFGGASAQTTFGMGVRHWTGLLADETQTGLTLSWDQSLQYRYFGFNMGIGTAYYLTNQEPPPLSRGMQTYSLRLGPRGMLPWGKLRFYSDLQYERLGVVSNALVRKTGEALSYNAIGGALGIRYLTGPLVLGIRGSYSQVIEFQAGMVGLSLHLGLNGAL